MKKYLVITSIFPPTEAVKKFAERKDIHIIIVGDKKSPSNYDCQNTTFLSVKNKLNYKLEDKLPYNHYARKMLGYIYASKNGADIIIDTDDDNAPKDNWDFPDFNGNFDITEASNNISFLNVYKYYTDKHIWPRGFNLKDIKNENAIINKEKISNEKINVGIWQGLVDGEPDVDAIYRLIDNEKCSFNESIPPIVLNNNCYCPFNTQNTAIRKELFPLMYIPATVTFRFCDILRGLVAQPIMQIAGYKLGFTTSTVIQDRNEHDYLKDFKSEIPCYLEAYNVIEIVQNSISQNCTIKENLKRAYNSLCNNNIVTQEELVLLDAWLDDI